MRKSFPLLVILLSSVVAFGQNIGIGTNTPDASALLEVKSTGKGVLLPRMTLSQRNAIASPTEGLVIYQTDNTPGFYFYTGSQWEALQDDLGNHSMLQNLRTNGKYISRNITPNLGILMQDSGAVTIRTNNSYPGYTGIAGDRFTFDAHSGFVAKGILGIGNIPASGAGERMMWHPYKAAFRAGSIGSGGTQWDDANTGFYSVAFGYNTTALGLSTLATGYQSNALGSYSNALGYSCLATGTGSVAIGYRCTADADYGIAIGQRASVNGHAGALVLSDASTTDSVQASANNQFSSRYAGGYRFFTNSSMTTGVQLTAGGSSWSVISDSTKKEHYAPVSTEYFLSKLSGLRIGSWNYKGQDAAHFRHYGPMAQEIYSAFGKDRYGTIGCDTLLASADMDGIMMIMLQGLEQRSRDQKTQIENLQKENEALKAKLDRIDALEADLKRLAGKL